MNLTNRSAKEWICRQWIIKCINSDSSLSPFSVGPVETFPREMVSRRKILSRSRDDLNLDQAYLQQQQEEEEDVWYNKDKLFKVSDKRCL